MSNLHLVTGYAGAAHITPDDHGSLYAAIFGNGSYVLDRGNKLSASAITSNQIRVLDGDMVIQGRHVRLAANTYVDLRIENGAQGVYRNDLIVARYTKNGSTGVEECNLVVIKGTAAASDPQDPAYITGDLLGGGATQHDFPLYRVPLNGLTVGALVPLFTVAYLVTLGSDGKVPADYLPAMNYVPTSQKGAANGVASLDSTGKVPSGQLPSMNYIPTSQKGAVNGVAPLNESGSVDVTRGGTGAKTKQEACKNLDADFIGLPSTQITVTDMNNLFTPGVYRGNKNTTDNVPVSISEYTIVKVEVWAWSSEAKRVKQTVRSCGAGTYTNTEINCYVKEYVRYYVDSGWSTWENTVNKEFNIPR